MPLQIIEKIKKKKQSTKKKIVRYLCKQNICFKSYPDFELIWGPKFLFIYDKKVRISHKQSVATKEAARGTEKKILAYNLCRQALNLVTATRIKQHSLIPDKPGEPYWKRTLCITNRKRRPVQLSSVWYKPFFPWALMTLMMKMIKKNKRMSLIELRWYLNYSLFVRCFKVLVSLAQFLFLGSGLKPKMSFFAVNV